MENFIYWFYESPMFLVLIMILVIMFLYIIFEVGSDIEERFRIRKENDLLKRDLSYCKQFMSKKDFERYKLHRQFDIELENYLKEQRNG